MSKLIIVILTALVSSPAFAKVKVVATTTDLAAIAKEVGGDSIEVETLCKGAQDPHFIEAKPSFMVKVNKADLVLAVGLGLETGWISNILRGARNPNVNPGTNGYLEVGPQMNPIEVAKGSLSRSQGDIHPDGNPHFTLDPIRTGHAAMVIAERLGKLDAEHAQNYLDRAKKYKALLEEKSKGWATRLEKVKNRKLITYHKTLNYFFERYKFEVPITLEPKPGIPPTASHILAVMKTIKDNNIKLVMVENFFDVKVAQRIKEEVPAVQLLSAPVAVDGDSNAKDLVSLYEWLVKALEENGK
ncbi:MAG: metal ABC transporter substrate-binding protein [Bdellovibrionia bacterium]